MNPNIALSYKPVELDIEGAMQFRENKKRLESQNALAAAEQANQQDKLRNSLALREYAANADFNDPKQAMSLMRYGESGANMLQSLQAGQASSASARKTGGEYANQKADYYLNGVLPFARNSGRKGIISMLDMMRKDPDLAGSPLASMPKEFADANLPDPIEQPEQYAQWEQRMGMGLSEFLKQNAPKFTQVDAGGYGYTQQIPGLGGPATEVPGSRYTKTMSPAEKARLDAETETGNYSEDSKNLMAALVAQGFPLPIPLGRGSASDALKNDIYERAGRISQGLSPSGKPAPAPTPKPGAAPSVAPAAAPAASAVDVASNIGNARQDQVGRASSIRYYSSGMGNRQITSLNTAVDHLDTLSELSTALQNGDVKLLNRFGQAWKEQTGEAAPTNIDGAKVVIAREILKAITATGGGVAEAEELQATMSRANSPAQLVGIVNTYQKLLAGQLESIGTQYKFTTGRNDFEGRLSDRTKRVLGRGKGADDVAQVKTDADFDKLPSGTLFVGPDGKQRRKP